MKTIGLKLLPYYVVLLTQKLAFLPNSSIVERIGILKSLASILLQKTSEKEKKKWNKYNRLLLSLIELELKARMLETELRQLEYEIILGNLVSLDDELINAYKDVISTMAKNESLILDEIQSLFGDELVAQVILPSNR